MKKLKQREIESLLHSKGYHLKKCSKHMIYSNGEKSVAVPYQHANGISEKTLVSIFEVVLGSRQDAKEFLRSA